MLEFINDITFYRKHDPIKYDRPPVILSDLDAAAYALWSVEHSLVMVVDQASMSHMITEANATYMVAKNRLPEDAKKFLYMTDYGLLTVLLKRPDDGVTYQELIAPYLLSGLSSGPYGIHYASHALTVLRMVIPAVARACVRDISAKFKR